MQGFLIWHIKGNIKSDHLHERKISRAFAFKHINFRDAVSMSLMIKNLILLRTLDDGIYSDFFPLAVGKLSGKNIWSVGIKKKKKKK